MAFKDSVKQWFQTDDLPDESQFYNWMDWARWKDEKIAFADLTPELQSQITATSSRIEFGVGVTSFEFADHTLIEKVMVIASADTTFSMGTTIAGTEIFDNVAVTVADRQTGLMGNPYYCVGATTLYWSALPASSKLIVFIK